MLGELLAAGVAMTNGASGQPSPPVEPGNVLAYVVETPKLDVSTSTVEGKAGERSYQVALSPVVRPQGRGLRVTVVSRGRTFGEVLIDLNGVTKLDFQTAKYYARPTGPELVSVNIRFGDERDCFVNDDGRDILTITFSGDLPVRANHISLKSCEPEVLGPMPTLK